MPQGVTNAPSTFQHLMDRCMGDTNLKEVLKFLDDIIVFSETLKEHEERLMKVLNSLQFPDSPLLLGELNCFDPHNKVLYRKRQDNGRFTYQLILPEEFRTVFLQSLHNDMGHLGIKRTLDLVQTRFFWPKMAADVERKVKTCDWCIHRKGPPDH